MWISCVLCRRNQRHRITWRHAHSNQSIKVYQINILLGLNLVYLQLIMGGLSVRAESSTTGGFTCIRLEREDAESGMIWWSHDTHKRWWGLREGRCFMALLNRFVWAELRGRYQYRDSWDRMGDTGDCVSLFHFQALSLRFIASCCM